MPHPSEDVITFLRFGPIEPQQPHVPDGARRSQVRHDDRLPRTDGSHARRVDRRAVDVDAGGAEVGGYGATRSGSA